MSRILGLFDFPPVWLALGLVLMWAIDRYVPIADWPYQYTRVPGWIIIAAAIALTAWAALPFARSRTSIVPRRRPAVMITHGPYRISRNPIYLADVLAMAGFGLVLASTLSLLVIPLFILVIERRFIVDEESMLHLAFGRDYEIYAGRTPRWI